MYMYIYNLRNYGSKRGDFYYIFLFYLRITSRLESVKTTGDPDQGPHTTANTEYRNVSKWKTYLHIFLTV